MKTITKIVLALVALCVTSCRFGHEEFVDFTDIEAAKGLSFKVIGQSETDLTNGLPVNCYLPDGIMASEISMHPELSGSLDVSEGNNDGPHRVNSTTGTNIVQQLMRYGNKYKVTEIVGTYPSRDVNYHPIRLSGKVMLPKGHKPKRMILVSHYTVGSNAEAPSNCFSLEGVLVKMGYGLIIPDYLGYGMTSDRVHPYLVMDLTARNVLDMYLAVRPWLEAVGKSPEKEDIYLMGYSQGGATTMAVEHLIEAEYSAENDPERVLVHRVFAGGGPYDVKATYERFVNTDTAGYPVAVPLVLQGMIKGNNLKIDTRDLMQEWLYDKMNDWVNSKHYTTAQVNKLIGTTVTHDLLTQEAMTQTSDNVAELYKAMTVNSIISYNWQPQASVYIMHSMDDETVPYTNATNAKSKWHNANITYNFGHYGSHVMTCLRFIYSVQSLIKQEEEEESIYE
ncbi:MAG: hypothetical protein K6A36_07270 [Paludibacteraceae bacterium]|nr:hypothetical protein [Paludibacteraceae bacterium]